jgi:hypothetical protein
MGPFEAAAVSAIALLCMAMLIVLLSNRVGDLRGLLMRRRRASVLHFDQRLDNPQFDEVERVLGVKVPASVRKLYSHKALLHMRDFRLNLRLAGNQKSVLIRRFLPLDAETLTAYPLDIRGERDLPIAEAFDGDALYVSVPNDPSDDAPVYLFRHDGGDRIELSQTLSHLLTEAIRQHEQ